MILNTRSLDQRKIFELKLNVVTNHNHMVCCLQMQTGRQCCYDLKMKYLILLNVTGKAYVPFKSVVSQFVHSPFNRQNVW